MKEFLWFLINFVMGIASGFYGIYMLADILGYDKLTEMSRETRFMTEIEKAHKFIYKLMNTISNTLSESDSNLAKQSKGKVLYTEKIIDNKFVNNYFATFKKNRLIIFEIKLFKLFLAIMAIIQFAGGMAYKGEFFTRNGLAFLLISCFITSRFLFFYNKVRNTKKESFLLWAYNYFIMLYIPITTLVLVYVSVNFAVGNLVIREVYNTICISLMVIGIVDFIRIVFLEKMHKRNIVEYMYDIKLTTIRKDSEWVTEINRDVIYTMLKYKEFKDLNITFNKITNLANDITTSDDKKAKDVCETLPDILEFLSVLKLEMFGVLRNKGLLDDLFYYKYKIHTSEMLNQLELNIIILCNFVKNNSYEMEE